MGAFPDEPSGWDAILTDLSIPRMSGLQLANQIASTGSSAPILQLSGKITMQDEQMFTQARFNTVLHKPVDQYDLLRALQLLLHPRADGRFFALALRQPGYVPCLIGYVEFRATKHHVLSHGDLHPLVRQATIIQVAP